MTTGHLNSIRIHRDKEPQNFHTSAECTRWGSSNGYLQSTMPPEILLDRIDLSKAVDRHGMERCHILSPSVNFLVAVVCRRRSIHRKKAKILDAMLKKVIKDPEMVLQACRKIHNSHHPLLYPVLSVFSDDMLSV